MNAKNGVIAIAVMLLLSNGYQQVWAVKAKKAKNKNPGFSLHNKSKKVIWVDVSNGKSWLQKLEDVFATTTNKVLADGYHDTKIDTTKETRLAIYDGNEKILYNVKFPKNKNIYIKWDGENLLPQKGGGFKGIKGKITGTTSQGYPLENNVKEDDLFE
jgi:hypothetical protein